MKIAPSRGAFANASWNALATVWGIAISFILAPVLIHKLGAAQYGVLLLVWSFTGILGLAGFGFGEATLRYMAHYYGRGDLTGVNRVMGATLSFYLVVCLIICSALFVAAPLFVGFFNVPESDHGTLAWLLRLSALTFSLRAVTLAYAAVPMALHRYDISSTVGFAQSVVRSAGCILLAVGGYGVIEIVAWDMLTQVLTLATQACIARRISPGVKLLPSLRFSGLREIVGFSVFSFLTYIFYMMHRESAKMVLGNQLGPTPVAYLGTPDNVAQRLHTVVASGGETLMPRFSANRHPGETQSLVRNATWSSLVISLVLLLPLVVLLPDFLRLWINPEFAAESTFVGQLVALSYISQGAYVPIATYFRGTGRPWLVTIVVLAAGATTLISCALLVPSFGVVGAGYAFILGSLPAGFGLLHGWISIFGRRSLRGFARVVALPVLISTLSFPLEEFARSLFPTIGWLELVFLGGVFVVIITGMIGGADWLIGGVNAPSKHFVAALARSEKLAFLFRWRLRHRTT